MSPRNGTFEFVSMSESVVKPPMTAVWPFSNIIVVTMVLERVRGKAMEPSEPPEPTVNTSKPGGASDELPVPERLVSFGMTSITIFFVPGITFGRMSNWKPTSTGEELASATDNCRPPAWPCSLFASA